MKTCHRLGGGFVRLWFLALATAAHLSAATLISTNATWKYLADGTDQGTAWQSVAFNDSAWPSGAAQLGYGDGDEATVIPNTNGAARPVTVYFRRTIFVPSGMADAALRLMRDDGAVVYINGVEVRRDNMPAGPVAFNTLAVTAVGGADESTFFETAVSPSAFVAGTNVIAVEVHQVNVTSSDLSFALELRANFGPPGPTVTVEATTRETREQSPLVDAPNVPAVFRITRTGPTNSALGVNFQLSGTASNGVDYEFVSNALTIPAGSASASVEIFAIDDAVPENTESVVLTLQPTPCLECYNVGTPGSATAYIVDNEESNAPPTVAIFSPSEGENFAGPTNVTLRATAHDPENGEVASLEFFEGTNRIGAAAFYPTLCPANCPYYALTWSNVPPGNYTVTAVAKDNASNVTTSAPVRFSVSLAPPVDPRILVATGSVWKYLDDGTDQGSAWRAPAFNDSTWAQGPAQLGYGDGDEATWLNYDPDGDGQKFITYYFRRAFGVSDASGISNLVVRLLRDDGGVIYLNGVEVFRSNMPTGAVTFQTRALTSVCCEDESTRYYDASIDPRLLVEGANVLAVEIHQYSPVSADVSFDLELVGERGARPPERTVVNVFATDAQAGESGADGFSNPGQFAIRRSGNLASSIPVHVTLSGSASNGVDYTFVSNSVVIPAGATQALIQVSVREDGSTEGTETVVLALQTPVCPAVYPPPPECYEVGPSPQATVFIADAPRTTNEVPFVQLNEPRAGDSFMAPTSIVLRAYAQDAEDGNSLRVEFFAGNASLGVGTFVPTLCPAPYCPFYQLTWSNVPPGHHTLTARATDSAGATGVSAAVPITVYGRETNAVPTVTIVRPTNGAVFILPTDILIEAVTRDADGYADTVEFFADNQKIGESQIVFVQAPSPGDPIYFDFTWTNPPPGRHVLTATTRDNFGARAMSAPVHITVDGGTNIPTSNVTLIATGAVWKYNDAGVNLGTAWRAHSYDDSAWASGPAQLGYGEGDEATVVGFGPDPANKYITTYFRRSFAVSNAARVVKLSARLLEDDGAVVYLNGTEVLRSNLPGGMVTYSTLATAVAENQVVNFPVPVRLLRTGQNLLAVEMHQVNRVSSDLSFDFELRGEVGRRRPWLHVPIQNRDELRTNGCRLVLDGDAPATCVVECSEDLRLWTPISTNQLWNGAVDVTDAAAANGPRRFYRVRME